LDAYLHQQVEKARFLFRAHRIDESLIAIAQIGGEPDRRFVYHPARPLAVGQVDGRKRPILGLGIRQHGHGMSRWRMSLPFAATVVRLGVFDLPWAPRAPGNRRVSSRPRA